MLINPRKAELIKNKHWEEQTTTGQHWSLLGLTKLMSQEPHFQHKDSSGLYYTHDDCERPSDMPPSSNRLPRGSDLQPVGCKQEVVRRASRCVKFGREVRRNTGSGAV